MGFCSLGSGSKGNCTYVSDGETSILVDAGLPVRTLTERLLKAGIDKDSINAIIFTHNHCDHYQGARGLARTCPAAAFYANEGTAEGIDRALSCASFEWQIFESSTPFEIGPMTITPFRVPHNAADPVGFTIVSQDASWASRQTSDVHCPLRNNRWRIATRSSLKATTGP